LQCAISGHSIDLYNRDIKKILTKLHLKEDEMFPLPEVGEGRVRGKKFNLSDRTYRER